MYNKKLSFMLGILLASSLVMVSATQNGGRAIETTSPISPRLEKREEKKDERKTERDERKDKREERKEDRKDKREEKKEGRKEDKVCKKEALATRTKTKLNIQKDFVDATTLLRKDRLTALEAVLTASSTATTTKGIAQERREKRELIQKDFEAKRKLANKDRITKREDADKVFEEAIKACRNTPVTPAGTATTSNATTSTTTSVAN